MKKNRKVPPYETVEEAEKTREQLIDEVAALRKRIEQLESADANGGAGAVYRTFAEKSFAFMYLVQEGRFRFVNSVTAACTGYKPSELLGCKSDIIVHPDDRERVRINARSMLQGKIVPPYEFRIITKSGETRSIVETVTPIVLDGNRAILGNSLDITEYRRTQEALQESEQRLMEIIDFLPDATLVIDREGKIIAWNKAIEEMTGFRADEMLGKGNYESAIAFYGDRRPILIDLVNLPSEVIEEKYVFLRREKGVLMGDAECSMVRKGKRFLSGWATPICNLKGEIVGAIESIRDLTEKKQAEEAVRESEQRLMEIIDFLPDATLVIDREGKIIAWNRAIEEMTGYTADEMLGKGNYESAIAFYGDRRPILIDLVNLPSEVIEEKYVFLRREKGVLMGDAECPIVRKGKRFLSGWATPIYNLKGEIVGAIESIRDLTEKKQAEEELQQAKDKLEMWVGELEKRNREMQLLRQMDDLLHTCDAGNEAYLVIEQFIPQLFPNTNGALFSLGKDRKSVESVITWGDNLESDNIFSTADCWALRRGQKHVVNSLAFGLRCRHMNSTLSDYIDVPMMAPGEIMGLLHIEFQKARCDQGSEELALVIAEHLSLSLSNLKLRETLHAQSVRDPLTGLFNRRYMEESLARELHRAQRSQYPISIIMLDIDNFKQLNDSFGHESGDKVLMELGALIQRTIRGGDIACRYGGEEFILILPNSRTDTALMRAEMIRSSVEGLQINFHRQSVEKITVSLGVAAFPDHGENADVIIKKADDALYEAKRRGRNRVEVCTG